MERSQKLMYQICVTGLKRIGIQRHDFTVNVAAFSPEKQGKKGCFSLTFFLSTAEDTMNRMSLRRIWHTKPKFCNQTEGNVFVLTSNICTIFVKFYIRCTYTFSRKQQVNCHWNVWPYCAFKKEKKMMVSSDSDIGLMLMFPLKENYLQAVQSWAPHQNLKIPQEDLQVTLSSVAAEVHCLTRMSDSRCTWYKLQTAF